MSLLELFYAVVDFCRQLEPAWRQQQLASGLRQRQRTRQLCLSEIMTILIAFHCSGYRNFKTYHQEQVCRSWRAEARVRLAGSLASNCTCCSTTEVNS